jgi:hypothetical protein
MNEQDPIAPSITFLNSTGDITVTWEKDKEPEMLALIDQKMKAGYTFFILKPRLGGLLGHKRVVAETIADVKKAGSVIAPDALGKSIVMNLGDAEVSAAVAAGHATVMSAARGASMDTVRRAASAAEVAKSQTVAIRPITGG